MPRLAVTPLPLGGPKGSGFALLVECLTSLLAGQPDPGPAARETERPAPPEWPHHRDRHRAVRRCRDISRRGRAVGTRDPRAAARSGRGRYHAPGERGDRIARKRGVEGIPIPAVLRAELDTIAERLGVAPLVRFRSLQAMPEIHRTQEKAMSVVAPPASQAATEFDVGGVRLPRPFRIRRLGHFGVNVADPEVSRRFYCGLLGFRVSDPLDFGPRLDPATRAKYRADAGLFHAPRHRSPFVRVVSAPDDRGVERGLRRRTPKSPSTRSPGRWAA